MGLSEQFRRLERNLVLGPPPPPPRRRSETMFPAERARIARSRTVAAYVLSVLLPVASALALLPLRSEHAHVVALVLFVPVIAVAVLGAVGPAVAAAIVAGVVYDVVHTKPYWHVAIDDPDDIATTITLVVVGMTVGLLCSQVMVLRARDTVRHNELQHLVQFAQSARSATEVDGLALEGCRHLTALLDVRDCRWHAGFHGTVGAVLLPTGQLAGESSALRDDRAQLPKCVEIPAIIGNRELGRFILATDHATLVSAEERLTAATIVNLFAHVADQLGRDTGTGEQPTRR